MRIPYCNANKEELESWVEKKCIEKNCPWLVYVCRVEAQVRGS